MTYHPNVRVHACLFALTSALLTPVAMAHPADQVGGLADGLFHPWALDHLAAMLAVGLWSALAMAGWRSLLGPAAFVGGMLMGCLSALSGLTLPGVETGIGMSLLVLAALMLPTLRAQWRIGVLLIGIAGAVHGQAHGLEASADAYSFVGGMLASTALLHAAGWWVARGLLRQRETLAVISAGVLASGGLIALMP